MLIDKLLTGDMPWGMERVIAIALRSKNVEITFSRPFKNIAEGLIRRDQMVALSLADEQVSKAFHRKRFIESRHFLK
jgi:hypothetical protein